jgi:hypothetical protein
MLHRKPFQKNIRTLQENRLSKKPSQSFAKYISMYLPLMELSSYPDLAQHIQQELVNGLQRLCANAGIFGAPQRRVWTAGSPSLRMLRPNHAVPSLWAVHFLSPPSQRGGCLADLKMFIHADIHPRKPSLSEVASELAAAPSGGRSQQRRDPRARTDNHREG